MLYIASNWDIFKAETSLIYFIVIHGFDQMFKDEI